MATKRVHEIAKERGITSKEALQVLRSEGLDVKAAASKVEEEQAARAFRNAAARPSPPPTPPPQRPDTGMRLKRTPRPGMRLKDFVAWVEAEQPEQLSVAEVARVVPPPWFTRSGSGKGARIRLPLGEQKYERRQGDHRWRRVEDWTMGPPR
jgi:Translation initiation factor IF-2, N-terminal region